MLVMPTPYCTYKDIADYLSDEGVQLRMDDDNSGTGQFVVTTSAAAIDATTLAVQALPTPLPAGTTLDFGGADMDEIVQVVLSAPASLSATSLTVHALPGAVNERAVAIDGGVNAFELARVERAIAIASSKINDYLIPRYQDESQLATSYSVNRWATIIACRWFCKRRGQSCPSSIEDDYKEAIQDLQNVAASAMQIGDIGTPVAEVPSFVNIIVRPEYWLRKARVQRPISSPGTPQGYSQSIDRQSEFSLEI